MTKNLKPNPKTKKKVAFVIKTKFYTLKHELTTAMQYLKIIL